MMRLALPDRRTAGIEYAADRTPLVGADHGGSAMRLGLALIFGMLLAGPPTPSRADAPLPASLGTPRAANGPGKPPAATLELPRPAARVGTPGPVARGVEPDSDVLYGDPAGSRNPAATLGPIPGTRPVSGISLAPADEPLAPEERYNRGLPNDPFHPPRRVDGRHQSRGGWLDGWGQGGDPLMNGRGNVGSAFASDHEFDSFISPVTNPFLAEDPRKLTELRPIFMFQTIPNSNLLYSG